VPLHGAEVDGVEPPLHGGEVDGVEPPLHGGEVDGVELPLHGGEVDGVELLLHGGEVVTCVVTPGGEVVTRGVPAPGTCDPGVGTGEEPPKPGPWLAGGGSQVLSCCQLGHGTELANPAWNTVTEAPRPAATAAAAARRLIDIYCVPSRA
jgi:hypothetical protein